MDNMTVKVRSNVREVVASYNFNDEGSMEVVSHHIIIHLLILTTTAIAATATAETTAITD